MWLLRCPGSPEGPLRTVGNRQWVVSNRQSGMLVILSAAKNLALPLRCQLGPAHYHSERSEESRPGFLTTLARRYRRIRDTISDPE